MASKHCAICGPGYRYGADGCRHAPAGPKDAGPVLSAEECPECGHPIGNHEMSGGCTVVTYGSPDDGFRPSHRCRCENDHDSLLTARVQAARAEERERIAVAIDEAPGFRRWIDDSRVVDKDVAIRIARTSPPAGDAT